jgi:hypothetical protein
MTRLTVSLATVLFLLLLCGQASAQRLLLGGGIGLGTGLERSDALQDKLFRRARTRIIAPFDLRVDEDESQGIGIVAVFEIEPRTSVGAELRYMRWLSKRIVGFAGVTSILAPRYLVGVDIGVDLHIPLNKVGTSIFIEPSISALPLGNDLPEDHVLLWGLIALGLHANL